MISEARVTIDISGGRSAWSEFARPWFLDRDFPGDFLLEVIGNQEDLVSSARVFCRAHGHSFLNAEPLPDGRTAVRIRWNA